MIGPLDTEPAAAPRLCALMWRAGLLVAFITLGDDGMARAGGTKAASAAAAATTGNKTALLTSDELTVAVDPSDLSLSVSVAGSVWLVGGGFTAHGLSPGGGGGLVAAGPPTSFSGSDGLGHYTGLKMGWRNSSSSTDAVLLWRTSIRAYDTGGRVAFRQEHPAGIDNSDTPNYGSGYDSNGVSTAFPYLYRPPGGPELGMVEYAGSSAGNMVNYGSFPDNVTRLGEMSGAVAIVPRPVLGAGAESPLRHSLVFSQLDHFFAAAIARIEVPSNAAGARDGGQSAAGAGLISGYSQAPTGFASEAVLVLASASDATAVSGGGLLTRDMAGMPPGGVNHAAQKWGDTLLQFHGNRTRTAVSGPLASARAQYFGYSTTAFYHHNPCDPSNGNLDTRSCKSWEATLIDVHKDLTARGIPYKWMLIDSYWYGENRYGGTWLWEDGRWLTEADPSKGSDPSSPGPWPQRWEHGLGWFRNQTQLLSFGAHAGTWVNDGNDGRSPYANASDPRQIGEWTFVDDPKHPGKKKLGFPQGDALYEYLFSKNKEWGLGLIKQDHITDNPQIHSDADAWTKWFDGMGSAAAKHGVRMMYCMAPAGVLLNSVRYAASEVTRASGDYIVGHHGVFNQTQGTNGQWQIGPDAMFHWSLGLLPYKDTFLSNTTEHAEHTQSSLQPAGKYYSGAFNGQEGNPTVHALMAILSAAYVTCSDGVGSANVTLLSRLYRADGVLLKPTRPVTAIDAQLLHSVWSSTAVGAGTGETPGAAGQLYSTHSIISGYRWSFVTGVSMAESFVLKPEHIALPKNKTTKWISYAYNFGQRSDWKRHIMDIQVVSSVVIPQKAGHPYTGPLTFRASSLDLPSVQYQVIVPVFGNGLALLGELGKLVPVSPGRISSVAATRESVAVGLLGAPGEVVTMTFYALDGTAGLKVGGWEMVECTVGAGGSTTMHYPSKRCD